MHQLTFAPSFAGWQRAARRALQSDWLPQEVFWQELGAEQPLLDIGEEPESAAAPESRIKVPKNFVDVAARVACHAEPERWSLLYRMLWRITHGEHHLMHVAVDPDVHHLLQMDKAVRHDLHKMRAFVRFRKVEQ